MKYKVSCCGLRNNIHCGIYLNLDDLISALFNEATTYKQYSKSVLQPLSYEDFLKENKKQIEKGMAAAENKFIDIGAYRITELEE